MSAIWVAMSGGVDSSVAAALLRDAGHEVLGVTLLLGGCDGDDDGHHCVDAARSVCEGLGIAHRVVDMRAEFAREVVSPYVEAYASGTTPNPCVTCNARIKFGGMLRRALDAGAHALATGHYCRVVTGPGGERWLSRAADPARDQSYFLYRLGVDELRYVMFPVGGMRKSAVRAYAAERGLPSADRAESREACFVPDGDAAAFVGARRPDALTPGPVVDASGAAIGIHRGIARYTVGQRKGIGVARGVPLYVTSIDAGTRTVTVGDRQAVEVTRIEAVEPVWRGRRLQAGITARVRYRGREVPCEALLQGERLVLELAEPAEGVAPGQAVVCYADDLVIGGGTVAATA